MISDKICKLKYSKFYADPLPHKVVLAQICFELWTIKILVCLLMKSLKVLIKAMLVVKTCLY